MLKAAQILAESISPPLSEEQVLALLLLVREYPIYIKYSSSYPDLEGELQKEVDSPTVKTKSLKAVLTALAKLPNIVVESNGSADAQKFFSAQQNWWALAQDVLNTMYRTPVPTGSFTFAMAQRKIKNLLLKEDIVITEQDTGRRY